MHWYVTNDLLAQLLFCVVQIERLRIQIQNESDISRLVIHILVFLTQFNLSLTLDFLKKSVINCFQLLTHLASNDF